MCCSFIKQKAQTHPLSECRSRHLRAVCSHTSDRSNLHLRMIRDSFHMSVVNCTGTGNSTPGNALVNQQIPSTPKSGVLDNDTTNCPTVCVVTSHGVAVLLRWSQGSCADPIGLPLLSKGIFFQQSEDLTELNLTKSSSSSPQLWDGPQV